VVAMVAMLFIGDLAVNMVLLTIVMVGTYACKGPFWALATEALPASISAAAIAQINALGSLPGFGASYLIGAIKDATGSYPLAIMPIAALCLAGVIGVLFLGQRPGPAQPIRQAGEIA
jgi:ACS family tartrate transporter-like MFS transporter